MKSFYLSSRHFTSLCSFYPSLINIRDMFWYKDFYFSFVFAFPSFFINFKLCVFTRFFWNKWGNIMLSLVFMEKRFTLNCNQGIWGPFRKWKSLFISEWDIWRLFTVSSNENGKNREDTWASGKEKLLIHNKKVSCFLQFSFNWMAFPQRHSLRKAAGMWVMSIPKCLSFVIIIVQKYI